MSATPLWVPLAAAGLAVLGTLAGVVVTQAWASRSEERRWAREDARLREDRAREDQNRSYEHRRAAYVDFLGEFDRLRGIYAGTDRESPLPVSPGDPVFDGLHERFPALGVYGTPGAQAAASECRVALMRAAAQPQNDDLADDVTRARTGYVSQVREDLGVPGWEPR